MRRENVTSGNNGQICAPPFAHATTRHFTRKMALLWLTLVSGAMRLKKFRATLKGEIRSEH